jgi:excisionase family DNA binding protein
MTEDKVFFSRQEFSAKTGLSIATIQRAISAKKLPHIKIGRRVLIPAHVISNLIQAAEVGVAVTGEVGSNNHIYRNTKAEAVI